MKPLVIIGCGGFGREVHDIVLAINAIEPTWDLMGYIDDAPSAENTRLVESRSTCVLGPLTWLDRRNEPVWYVIGIGTGSIRATIDDRLRHRHQSATLIHPSATFGFDVRIGRGSVICAGARFTTNIHLGRHVHIHVGSTIGHDANLRDYTTVLPLSAISGSVTLQPKSGVGTNAAVLQGLTVGESSFVGAGACVVKNVPSDTIVRGVPAK